jgi:hypothetical protein
VPPGFGAGFVIDYVFAVAMAVFLCAPALAGEDWKEVGEDQALLEFKDATRTRVVQRKGWKKTLERSYWSTDDCVAISTYCAERKLSSED